MQVELRILRYDPERDDEAALGGATRVEADPMDRVLDLLHKVKYEQDGTLTFRRSCAHGVCGSDAMLINGRNRLACKIRVDQLGKQRITVAPLPGLPVIKDLVVDMDGVLRQVPERPAVPPVDDIAARSASGIQSAGGARAATTTRPSASCAPPARSSCPSFWAQPSYVGPGGDRQRPPVHLRLARRRRPTSGSRSSPTRTACGAAGRSSTARTPARAASTSPRRSSRSARAIVERRRLSRAPRLPGHPAPRHPHRRGGAGQSRPGLARGRAHRRHRAPTRSTPRRRPDATISEALGVQTNNVAEWTGRASRALELARPARARRRSTCSSTRSSSSSSSTAAGG